MTGRPGAARAERTPPVVTASAIGQATFCPYALYLSERGAPVSAATTERLARGAETHRDWNASQEADGTRGDRWRGVVRVAVIVALVALVVLLAAR